MRQHVIRGGLVALVCLAVLACSPGAEDGPSGTVRQFYDDLNAGRYDAAKALYSADVRAMFQDPSFSTDDTFLTWADSETKNGSIAKFKISSSNIDDGGAATVEFLITYENGESQRARVSLTQEDGRWVLGLIEGIQG